jgi:hypothetical protein
LTTLKFARLVKWTMTTDVVVEEGVMTRGDPDVTRGICAVERREWGIGGRPSG